ncbi:dephospho-CoA kinase, partial [bacterium]|nr:dephospho-CoA kinase [bacterium]
MLVVGLTGGMCCGKTTVSSMFAELGCLIIDADLISRKLVERGEPSYK